MANGDGSILSLAAQIVSAHVANNAVAPDELPLKLINDVHHLLPPNAGLIAANYPRPHPPRTWRNPSARTPASTAARASR